MNNSNILWRMAINTTFNDAQHTPNIVLWAFLLHFISKERFYPETKDNFKEEYVYVIIGAGTAGSVVASRLSEVPCVNVLLLEAGDVPPAITEIPSYARYLLGSEIDWFYKTVPQEYSAMGYNERKVVLNAGRVIGGTSVINGMMYVRGNKLDFDEWEKMGAKGWSYKDVLPYFIKLENNANFLEVDPYYHGVGGPITATRLDYWPKIKGPIIEASANMGYELVDSNGDRQTGMFDYQSSIQNGRRCSVAKGYLVPVDRRTNLDILKNAFVTKILIENGKAESVQFKYGNAIRTVRVRKEIIVSAGAIRTPQLLMLSGIGPCEHLKRFKIPCLRNLPVGNNFHDHVVANMYYRVNESFSLPNKEESSVRGVLQYLSEQTGSLLSAYHCAITGFFDGINTTATTPDWPKQQIIWSEFTPDEGKGILNKKFFNKKFGKYEGKPLYSCKICNLHPYSVGYIRLKSSDPFEHPEINPNYLKDPRDMEILLEGRKICKAVAESKKMKKVVSEPLDTTFPNCKHIQNEEKLFECEAKTAVNTFYHFAGSSRMGSRHDPNSVVDPELRVIGIDNLRVADASVMPKVTSGNTHVPVIMIGEKVSDIIKETITCGNNNV